MKQHNVPKIPKNDHIIAIFLKIDVFAHFKKCVPCKTMVHMHREVTVILPGHRISDL